ncbi:MAG: alpha/beta fold hydrolase [Candidatus Azambacteria bacterium]|nr:alpha/beta fold hydrolase [Candidatus Azambacteria bacterium]
MKKMVSFQTKDNVKIVGDFYDGKNEKSILLLHILPGNRGDFNEFAEFLWQKGYSVLNIDERGHGDSEAWSGETGSWQEFTQADYDKTIYDIEAAAQWLKVRIPDAELAVIGGSIGANLALLYGAKAQPKIVIALSPGIDYHGIKTEIASRNYRQNILIVASRDDTYSFESSEKLFEISKASHKEFLRYEDAGHGTRMFNAEPELKQRIFDFLANNFG